MSFQSTRHEEARNASRIARRQLEATDHHDDAGSDANGEPGEPQKPRSSSPFLPLLRFAHVDADHGRDLWRVLLQAIGRDVDEVGSGQSLEHGTQ